MVIAYVQLEVAVVEPVKRIPIIEQVEAQIRGLVENGNCHPGEKLPTEKELCQSLGVGRGTVREALRLLQAKGLVELRPGRGAFAAEPTGADELDTIEWLVQNEQQLRDAIEIRRALEPLAARRMAECGDRDAVRTLAALHGEFLAAVESGEADRIAALDERFHNAIVVGSGNRLLLSIHHQINQEIKTFRAKTFRVPQNIRNAVSPHSSILRAIQDADADAAEAAMRAHLDKVQEDLSENIGAPTLH